MLSYNELKVGMLFIKDGEPYEVLDYAFVRMQQRKPVAQLKIKNLISGKVREYAAHQNDSFKEADIEIIPVEFIYARRLPAGRQEYWFHVSGNPKSRFALKADIVGEAANYLKQGSEARAFKFNEKIINIEPPVKMDLKETEAPPGVKGNTAQGGTKTVTLETGAKVNVPLFINEGDIIRINTASGDYVERVEKG